MTKEPFILAGYVTGETVHLTRVKRRHGELHLLQRQSFTNRDFSDLESILRLYLKSDQGQPLYACFGVAGPIIGGRVSATNIPWHISATEIAERFSIERVKLLNDLVATAHGLSELGPDKFYTINKGTRLLEGNIGLIAAGTGLGEAIIYTDGQSYFPYASEGGHAGFAPGNQLETELWEYLYSRAGEVEVEDVVSLGGLEAISRFLVDTHRSEPVPLSEDGNSQAHRILELALSGENETAVKTLDIFIDCYASEAANLALKGMTLGGIHLGGLIGPQIIMALDKGRFMERFVKRGKMESLLTRIPVRLIIEDKTALLGAAAVALRLGEQ